MADLDRAVLIELLGRLGADDDATVLQAARDLHRKVGQSGETWDDLIRAQPVAAEARAAAETGGASPRRRADDQSKKAIPDEQVAGDAETTRLLERLLARKDLSENLREELTEMKRALADGTLDVMDSRYIRALAKRLGT